MNTFCLRKLYLGFYGLSLHSGMMSCLLSPVFFYLFLAFGRNSCSLPPPTKNQREKFPPGFIPEQNLSFSLAKIQNDLISFCF
jgi:hypothetical protein